MKQSPLIAAACIAAISTAPAQSWNLPVRGVAFYKRTMKTTGKLPGLRDKRIPSVLLEGELDPKKRFVAHPPAHLQDLAMWVAFDVRKANKSGKIKAVIPYLEPYGELRLRGSISKPDDRGVQEMRLTVTRADPKRGDLPKRVFESHYKSRSNTNIEATLEIDRIFDASKGVVRSFQSRFFGSTKPRSGTGAAAAAEFAHSENWQLSSVKVNRYPGFTSRVKDAIDRGSEHIRKRIRNPDRNPFDDTENNGRTTNTGRLALALLTLLKSDVDPTDAVLKAGFDSLRRRNIKGAYECAAALMAMEALYAPVGERDSLISGRLKHPVKRKPSPADKKLMEEWTAKILTYTDVRIRNQAYERRFNYVAGGTRYDNSVTQYCVLGLYSAHLCDVKISPTVWFSIASHMLEDQRDVEGKPISLRLVTHQAYQKLRDAIAEAAATGTKGTRTVTSGRRVAPRGWAYNNPMKGNTQPNRPVTGSMTVAGITNLTICDAVLRSAKKGGSVLSKTRRATQEGLAWLLKNFSVRHNPGHSHHYLYYMYGLERAAELSQVALIGNRDWYFEGATMLIEMQTKNGSFGGDPQDCFGVLFLKQAAPPLPAVTGR